MSSIKSLVLQVRYPYTAGVIMTIWLGSAALLAIQPDLPVILFVVLNSIASIVVAILGFTTPRR